MRKNVAMFFMVVAMATLCACGSDNNTPYLAGNQQNQQFVAAAPGSFHINKAARSQKLIQKLDANGNILGLQGAGTMKYKSSDIESVMYISDRQYFEMSPTVDAANSNINTTFVDTINNDYPQIIFLMKDGEQYPVDMPALTFTSSEPMRYFAKEWGFEYGHRENSEIIVTRNTEGTMITLNVFFGCDKLVGLAQDNIDPLTVGGVAWQLEDGALYPVSLSTNSFGSYYASIDVPLFQVADGNYYPWKGASTTGRMVVYSKNGMRVPFVDSETESGFWWDYNYDYPTLQRDNPYWDDPAKRDIIQFYIPI